MIQLNNFIQIQNKHIRVLYLTTLVLFLPLFGGLYFLYSQEQKKDENVIAPEVITPISVNLDQVQTTAYAAFVVSLTDHQVLYKKNPDKLLPLASLTKLVTASVANDHLARNTVEISKLQELSAYGDPKLHEGEVWDTNELRDYTLVTSSNDGAHTLSTNSDNATSFTNSMNSLVASIGAVSTEFYNESGLDNDVTGVPGSKGTAQDMSKILSYLVQNDLPLYEKTQHAQITVSTPEGLQTAQNTNDVTDQITGLLVSKTGYTDLAGGNLAIVADMGLNEPMAFVVLKSSRESRFQDILRLQDAYFAQVREGMR
jgi:D-alanyl-D-alanine endopeptidase (penicillin-binding protein 7)